jgi:hypothetical protein
MASQPRSPVAIKGSYSHRPQPALSDSRNFERQLFSFLESSLTGPDTSSDSALQTASLQIAPSRWHGLLAEIFRPLGVQLRSVQHASELLCRCVINAEKLSGVIALVEQFPSGGLLPGVRYEVGTSSISIYSDSNSGQFAASILQLAAYLKLLSWLIGRCNYIPKRTHLIRT